MLKKLWNSTASLHARFGVKPEPATARPVFEEEVRELLEAADVLDQDMKFEGSDTRLHRIEFAMEAMDVIVTVLGLVDAYKITPAEFEEAGKQVIAKNAAKTNATHHINAAGKIAHRPK